MSPRRVIAPLLVPWLVVACAPRVETAAVALAWSLIALPGVMWLDVVLPVDHPLASIPVRAALGSVLALLPFAIIARIACAIHASLAWVLAGTAIAHAAAIAGAVIVARRRGPGALAAFDVEPEPAPAWSRRRAAVAATGIAIVLAAVAVASRAVRADSALRPGSAIGWAGLFAAALAGSIAAGIAFARSGASASPPPARPDAASRVPTVIAAIVALAVTLGLARVAYTLPATRGHPAWDIDDASYVAEAVDYAHGAPLGAHEPALGSDAAMPRARLQPLVAPLVATVSVMTGAEPAELAHSLLLPLFVVLGACALVAPLGLLFPRRPDAVGVGLAAALVIVATSWTFDRSVAEVIVFRAAQAKAIQLAVMAPLQLATLALAVRRPSRTHLAIAAAVAIVAHLTHPFATVAGAAWIVALAVAARGRRGIAAVAVLLGLHGGLAAEYGAAHGDGRSTASSRDPRSAADASDLVRTDDGTALPRQEPGVLIGGDIPFALGVAAIPLLVGLARRRRLAGALAIAAGGALAVCAVAPLGRLALVALPMPVLWRTRWLLPALPIAGAIGAALYLALAALIRRRAIAVVGAIAVVAGFGVLGAGRLLRPGRAPPHLSKMDDGTLAVVAALGGVDARPFVWAPLSIGQALPQLMPDVRLVMARDKTIRPAPADDVAFLAAAERRLARGAASPDDLRRVAALFPIDHIVFDGRAPGRDQTAAALTEAGWRALEPAGPYEVWRSP